MEVKTFEENMQAVLEKFYISEIFTQKGEKGEDEVIMDFTVQVPDRDKEILLVSGARLDDYRKNPIIQADHDFSVRSTVGSCKWIKAMGDRIRIAPRFASTQFGKDVETLVKEGHLKSVSHTFRGWGYVDNEIDIKEILQEYNIKAEAKNIGRIYTDWEPIEISLVVAGSNKEAVAYLAEKGLIKTKSLISAIENAPSLEEYIENRKAWKDEDLQKQLEELEEKCTPKAGETEKEFVGRCIGITTNNGTFSNSSQAAAYCHSQWRKYRGGRDIDITNLVDKAFKEDKYAQVLRSSESRSVQGDKYALGEQGIKGDNVELVAGINETFKTFKTKKEDDKNG